MGRTLLALVIVCLATAAGRTPARAEDATAGDLVISGAWARPSLGHAQNGSAYLTVQNRGSSNDRLVAVRSAAARKIEIHSHTMEGHTARMRPVQAIDIPAGATVKLDPNGFHIMFLSLKSSLQEGNHVPLVLVFEKAGTVVVDVEVKSNKDAPAPSQQQ